MASFLTKTRLRATLFVAVIAMVWLNQSIGSGAWVALRDRTFADPRAHVADLVRYPFIFLYRRSGDEEIYYATASALLGRPYDAKIFGTRGETPLPPIETPADGHVHIPYREVPFEYPPPNLPFFVAPRLFVSSFQMFGYVFGALMGILLVIAARIGVRLGERSERDGNERLVVFGLLLLAHGAIAIQRLDAIVALLLALMVRAAVRGEDRGLGFWAGMIGATKFLPILVLPAIVLASGVRETRRLFVIALFTGLGLLLGLGPMVVLGSESLPLVLHYHSARGLHVESALGTIYGAVKATLGHPEPGRIDFGSYNFHGPVANVLAKAATGVTLALVGVATWASRCAPRDPAAEEPRTEAIVLAALTTTTALWLGGKVFSPQYLTWALPLVIAIPGPSWKKVSALFGVVLFLSQLYLRGFYDHVYNQWPAGVLFMVFRLGVLVAFFVVTLRLSSRSRSIRPLPFGASVHSSPATPLPPFR